MDIFIARQPIFDVHMNVMAYELLYRNSGINASEFSDDHATTSVIINGLLMIGLDTLTDGKKAFIKFTRNLLLDDTAALLPQEVVVLEVLEKYDSDILLLKVLRKLKLDGYTIALDAYDQSETFGEILPLADIVKVDFQACGIDEIKKTAESFRGTRICLLAEKVETREQYALAKDLGFSYFQGYFFERPYVSVSKDIKSMTISHLRILQELGADEPDTRKIAEIIEADLSLSYKLLKLVNSAAYFGLSRITSVHQALVRLGLKDVFKLVTLVMMRDAGDQKPEELVRVSMIRGRAMEALACATGSSARKTEFFLVGLFSLIDVIMEKDMEAVLKDLPFVDAIKGALMGCDNVLKKYLDMVIAYEQGDWDALTELKAEEASVTDEKIINAYFDGLRWSKEILEI